MENLMNKELEIEVKALKKIIITSNQYKNLLKLGKQVKEHPEINNLSKQIIKLQKESLKINSLELDQQLEDLHQQLDNIPLYIQYINAAEAYNDLIVTINDKINGYVNSLTDLS